MNQKITFPELVGALSKRSEVSKRICEEFLEGAFATISASLAGGESVKIRRIGTFKVVEVEPRKSVNINTGETFEIKGHRKVTFTPEREFAETLNAPYSAFTTVELADDVTDQMLQDVDDKPLCDIADAGALSSENNDLSITAEIPLTDENNSEPLPEFVDDCEVDGVSNSVNAKFVSFEAEAKDTVKNDEYEANNLTYQEIANNNSIQNVAEEVSVDLENHLSETVSSDNVIENSNVVRTLAPPPFDVLETKEETDVINNQDRKSKKSGNRVGRGFSHGYICGAFTSFFIVVSFVLVWRFAAPSSFLSFWNPIYEDNNIEKKEMLSANTQSKNGHRSNVESIKIESQESQQKIVQTMVSDKQQQPLVYDTISTTRYLTTMAKEHYGNYHLWPYIYEENKTILGHPDRIRPGTKVLIPSASKYGIDANNPKCIEDAKRKGVEIYSRYK